MPDTPATTIERPWLAVAARRLSQQTIGLVRADWPGMRLIVSNCDNEPPKNFLGYPVVWERANA